MSKYNLTLPKMGESVEEATIVNWLKNVGDKIKEGDTLCIIEAMKLFNEIEAEAEGFDKKENE